MHEPTLPPPPPAHRLRRRDFLKLSALALLGYGAAKAVPTLLSDEPDVALVPLHYLSNRQARVVAAAAAAIVGPAGRQAIEAGAWDPAHDVDAMLMRMTAEQRRLLGVSLHLFEHATWGLTRFSRLSPEAQAAHAEAWRTSRIGLRRSIWGFLHAATASSFSSTPAGWAVMGYPGPTIPGEAHPGRAPGQTALFTWDEKVP